MPATGCRLLPRYTALGNQGRGFVLRPLAGVTARRSIVALARPDVAARTTIQQVLGMLRRRRSPLTDSLELRDAGHESGASGSGVPSCETRVHYLIEIFPDFRLTGSLRVVGALAGVIDFDP